jgi:hypothetical protein
MAGAKWERRVALVVVAAVGFSVLPAVWSVLLEVGASGWGAVPAAAFASWVAVALTASAALAGALARRHWAGWACRAVAATGLAATAAHLATSGYLRPADGAWLAASAALFVVARSAAGAAPERPRTRAADRAATALRGWAAAINLAAVPFVIETATETAAGQMGLGAATATLAVAAVTALLVAGSASLLTLRDVPGVVACAAGAAFGLAVLWPVATARPDGQPALALLLPAAGFTAAAGVALLLRFRSATAAAASRPA